MVYISFEQKYFHAGMLLIWKIIWSEI